MKTITKPKIIVVLGPTASGKSALAVKLAKKFNGEIISADSRQVYKGLDIGAGKITRREMQGVPHHLLDVASPKKVFTVQDFKNLGEKAIEEILAKGKVPIICGGTGFYIQALVENQALPDVPPNKKLRAELGGKTPEELFEILKKLDARRAESIDRKNPRRLIRAIEIAEALGKVPEIKTEPKYNVSYFNTDMPDEILKKRIHNRLLGRMKQGMVAEAKNLHADGLSWKRMEALGLEYKYLAYYLQKKMTKEAMLEKLEMEIWHYAKRQRTWFKKRNQ